MITFLYINNLPERNKAKTNSVGTKGILIAGTKRVPADAVAEFRTSQAKATIHPAGHFFGLNGNKSCYVKNQAGAHTSRPTPILPSVRSRPVAQRSRPPQLHANIKGNQAFTIPIVARRLQRQCLQARLLICEHRRHLPLGQTVDALVGPVLFPVIQVRLRILQTLELLTLQRYFSVWDTPHSTLSLRSDSCTLRVSGVRL